ncbi:hypothetical protein C8P63_10533 [Melghirimyces profundicolus]|uniref:Uncharacterized protein n=1 Tax=Melghirimyces profundicolus TaxID=1242148 RepID=A0A2T6C2B4_9BACL|nr:hypothetical protein [Melghirimyces profundicolus]PTX62438.1 hypothetical protein C8P63_10533 [Melghirimyces profundicolus]
MKSEENSSHRSPVIPEVDWGAQIADLKEQGYRTELWLNAILNCLEAKGMFTLEEVRKAVETMDRQWTWLAERRGSHRSKTERERSDSPET